MSTDMSGMLSLLLLLYSHQFLLLYLLVFVLYIWVLLYYVQGFPSGSVVNNLPANAGDVGLILGSGRSLGEGNGNPLQCSCLENPGDGEAWWAAICGVAPSRTRLKRHSSSSSSSGKESICQGRRHWFNPWVRKIPWSQKWQPSPFFFHGKFLGQRSLMGYSP